VPLGFFVKSTSSPHPQGSLNPGEATVLPQPVGGSLLRTSTPDAGVKDSRPQEMFKLLRSACPRLAWADLAHEALKSNPDTGKHG
jgi:hypothetical protein